MTAEDVETRVRAMFAITDNHNFARAMTREELAPVMAQTAFCTPELCPRTVDTHPWGHGLTLEFGFPTGSAWIGAGMPETAQGAGARKQRVPHALGECLQ